jgi:hypothetical protein
LVFAFSDFSIAGAAGVAGEASGWLACAKLTLLKAKLVRAITKTLIMFFTVSPPSCVLDDISKMLQS